jgi:hypothetical protein
MLTDNSGDAGNVGGYGKPPEHSRFKKGQSGNPHGRPKGSKNLRTLMLEELQKKVSIPANGKIRKLSKGQVVVMNWINQMMQGDHRARDQYLKLEEQIIAATNIRVPEDQVIDAYIVLEDGKEICSTCGQTCGFELTPHRECQGPRIN